MSVKDYPPTYLDLLRDGASEGKSLPMPDEATAVRFRQKLYQLRKAMRKEKHEWVDLVERVSISISYLCEGTQHLYRDHKTVRQPASAWQLRITRSDSNIEKILEDAGYKEQKAPSLD